MKKIIAIVVILLLMLGLCACKSKKVDNEQVHAPAAESEAVKDQNDKDDTDDTVKQEFADDENTTDKDASIESDNTLTPPAQTDDEFKADKAEFDVGQYDATDCFVGKVVAIEKVKYGQQLLDKYFDGEYKGDYSSDSSFRLNEDYKDVTFPLTAELYRYTVQVVRSVHSVFAEEGTFINVIADISNMTEEYRRGKQYLMKGTLYEFDGKTVMRLLDQFKAKVDEKGNLAGLSSDAKVFESVTTLDEFVNNKEIAGIFEKGIAIPSEILASYNVSAEQLTDAENKSVLERIISDKKAAILSDIKVKVTK